MIRINVNDHPFLLPGTWDELPQTKAVKILELRDMTLPADLFYWQALRILIDLPTGKWYSFLFWLMGMGWVEGIVKKKNPGLWAKWTLIRKAEEPEQLDILKNLQYLAGKPMFKMAPSLPVNLDDFNKNFHLKARIRIPDDDGRVFTFEQLIDAIMYYTNFSKHATNSDLNNLIATLYFYVSGEGNSHGYDPFYSGHFARLVDPLPRATKMMVYCWFQRFFEELVANHPDVFSDPEASGESSTHADPYGIAGFFYRMAGKQFGPLEMMKKTPGTQVLDGFQIEMYDFKNKPQPKPSES